MDMNPNITFSIKVLSCSSRRWMTVTIFFKTPVGIPDIFDSFVSHNSTYCYGKTLCIFLKEQFDLSWPGILYREQIHFPYGPFLIACRWFEHPASSIKNGRQWSPASCENDAERERQAITYLAYLFFVPVPNCLSDVQRFLSWNEDHEDTRLVKKRNGRNVRNMFRSHIRNMQSASRFIRTPVAGWFFHPPAIVLKVILEIVGCLCLILIVYFCSP